MQNGSKRIRHSVGSFECRIAPIAGMRAGLVIARFFQMGVPGGPGCQLLGFLLLYFSEAAIFAGVGTGFMTPPIFFRSDNARRFRVPVSGNGHDRQLQGSSKAYALRETKRLRLEDNEQPGLEEKRHGSHALPELQK